MQNKNSNKPVKETSKQSTKDTLGDKVGAAIEKVGHKIADAGFPKVGQAVHDLGDKIETNHKNPNHPHKVS